MQNERIAVGFQTGIVAYAVSLIIYQFGAVFLYHHQPTIWTGIAPILLSAMVCIVSFENLLPPYLSSL